MLRRLGHSLKKTLRSLQVHCWSLAGRAYLRLQGATVGRRLRLRSLPLCRRYGTGRIEIGEGVEILNRLRENLAGISHKTALYAGDRGSLLIGNDVGISGAVLHAVGATLTI